jgi:hypothetical protein
MLVLEAGEVCPHAATCPHNNNSVINTPCFGTVSSRKCKFECHFVVNGQIRKEGSRVPGDQTGKMKVIME